MHKNAALMSLALGAIVWAGPGCAAERAKGQKIAETWCVSCHTVSGGASARDAAPPFDLIARNRRFDRDGLLQVLSDPHPPMPKIHLSRQQLDDVIAYIHSLRQVD